MSFWGGIGNQNTNILISVNAEGILLKNVIKVIISGLCSPPHYGHLHSRAMGLTPI